MSDVTLTTYSQLLRYPDDRYPDDVRSASAAVHGGDADAARYLTEFANKLSDRSVNSLQELFTQTFDMSATCALEIGWHLFGEDYERGHFIVTVRGLLRDHDIAESTELPDHLSHILLLLERLPHERQVSLSREAVLPALEKIIKGTDEKDSPYSDLIRSIRSSITSLIKQSEGASKHA